MKKFPEKLTPPISVKRSRAVRQKELIFSASFGAIIRTLIIFFELLGVWLFGSSALLMDAIASGIDVLSTLLLILFIKIANRPPDKEHPFGHGRYEPFIGLQLGLMLFFIGGWLFVQQTFRLSGTTGETIIDNRAWIFPVIAVILLEVCYHFVMRTAKKQNSPALAADAIHYRIDSLTSLFAAIALLFAAFIPAWSYLIDNIGAIFISFLMIILGIWAASKNFNQLMDRTPDAAFFTLVKNAAGKVEGVLGTEKIRIQLYGPDAHVDIDIEVDPELSVDVAHKISQKVRLEIQKEWPAVRDVTVHIEPYFPGDH